MAARINTKFIIALVIGIVLVGGVIGALWYLQAKGDASRNVAEGDKHFEAGDYDRARAYYGRAVGKEPGRADYVRKLEETILAMRPQTTNRATELYRDRVNILRHGVRHNPTSPEVHERLIRELMQSARIVQQPDYWVQVEDAADEMESRVYDDDAKARAKVYRAMSVFARAGVLTDPSAMDQACIDLEVARQQLPNDDLTWAMLVYGQLMLAAEHRDSGRTNQSNMAFAKATEIMDEGRIAAPDGPELARVDMMHLLAKRSRGNEVSIEELEQAADRLISTLDTSQPPYMYSDAAEVLRNIAGYDNGQRLMLILEDYLEENPDSHQLRFYLARVQFLMQDFDGAWDNARYIMVAEPLPVSFPSRLQGEVRKRAAALVVDVEQERWALAGDETRAQAIENIKVARDNLATMVTDPNTDLLIARADGKLALAQGDFETAASRLETVIENSSDVDVRLLIYAATALEQIDAFGLALQRTKQAAVLSPSNPVVLIRKAGLEAELGRFDEARTTLQQYRNLAPELQSEANASRVASLSELIEQRLSGGSGEGQATVGSVFQAVEAAFAQGELDEARELLTNLLADNPNDAQILESLARLELSLENKDAARALLLRAQAERPSDRRLAGMLAAIDIDDPVDSTSAYLKAFFEEEGDRAVAGAINYSNLARSFDSRVTAREAEGDEERAAEAREIAQRARAMAQEADRVAQELRPDSTQLLEFQIFSAMRNEEWATAERLIAKAGDANLDLADGAFYRGRYELFRGRYDEALSELTLATSRIPWSNFAWRALASAAIAVGDSTRAIEALEQAYNCNPNHVETLQQYITLLVRLEQRARALAILRNARNRFTSSLPIREAWLKLEGEVGDGEVALEHRRKTYNELPSDQVNAFKLAELLSTIDPTRAMVRTRDGKVRYSQRAWARLGITQQDQLLEEQRKKCHQESDAIMDAAIAEVPDYHGAVALKAKLMHVRGETQEGEELLQQFLDDRADAQTVDMYLVLGRYQHDAKHFADAIATLEAGRELQSDEAREVDLELAQIYSRLGNFDKAIVHFSRVNEVAPSKGIQLQLIENQTRARQYDKADTLRQSVVDEYGAEFVTTMLEAGICEGRGEALYLEGDLEGAERQFAAQREALAAAQAMRRDSYRPHVMLARGLLRASRRTNETTEANLHLDDALMALEKAEAIEAGTVEASMVRVDIYREREDRTGAVAELTRLLRVKPDHDPARRMLLQFHLNNDELDSAIMVVTEGTEENSTMPYWFEMLGDLYALKMGDLESAGSAYLSAYKIAKDRDEPDVRVMQLVSKLADVWLASEDPNFTKVVNLIQEEDGRTDPLLVYLYARALDGLGQREEAIEQLRNAYAIHNDAIAAGGDATGAMDAWFRSVRAVFDEPGEADDAESFAMELCGGQPDTRLLRGMASIWYSSGSEGWPRAFELQQQAVDTVSDDDLALKSTVYLDLAQYQIVLERYSEAMATLAALLEWDPDNLLALNNYAYLLTEHSNDPERALSYIQRAAIVSSDNAAILDTLGWVEFKLGQYEVARQHLEASLWEEPAPRTYLHLAQALLAMDEPRPTEAQRQLELALEMGPDEQTKAEIEALSDDIRTRAGRNE
jgi:tetratricopeptide (TPR) repeat protein